MQFRDIHQLARKSYLETLLANEVSETLLLIVVVVVIEIPIAMVLLSLLLTRKVPRPLTLIPAAVTALGMVSVPPTDMDNMAR
ncbi:hypothetical protein SAMN05444004_11316 [Jannaschia faecimaris]|uniref:Uncharacterized protein n=1 Tax=Jannaschia faecimaris TaxID=1244108 RepID=A0A1H3SQZ3_9RHOB|nr:hypothetical protein [Jannaschia faecimaris]SDZ39971.1 hypothetical protein SAMN05444004_11316 [Jannaschia faecimaris]